MSSTINGTTYLTIADCMDRLPFTMYERTFRALVRKCGRYIVHRKQLILTEADLAAVLETLRQPECHSDSKRAGRVKSGGSRVASADSAISRARAQLANHTLKRA